VSRQITSQAAVRGNTRLPSTQGEESPRPRPSQSFTLPEPAWVRRAARAVRLSSHRSRENTAVALMLRVAWILHCCADENFGAGHDRGCRTPASRAWPPTQRSWWSHVDFLRSRFLLCRIEAVGQIFSGEYMLRPKSRPPHWANHRRELTETTSRCTILRRSMPDRRNEMVFHGFHSVGPFVICSQLLNVSI